MSMGQLRQAFPRLLKSARTISGFVLSFGLAKGTSFAAAIALPRVVNAELYGLIELAMTTGVVGASVLGLGIPAAATRFQLVERDERAWSMLLIYSAWLALAGLVAAAILAAFNANAEIMCCAAIMGLYGLQFSTSTHTRMRGYVHLSGWFDNLVILLSFLIVAALALLGMAGIASFTWAVVAASVAVAVWAGTLLVRMEAKRLFALIGDAVRVGVPMMFYGVASMLIFATPRIAMAKSLTLEEVARFSLCARIALILVFMSQLLSTGLFRQLYNLGAEALPRILSIWIGVLAGVATAMTVAALWLAPLLVVGTDIPATAMVTIFPAVVVQTTLWILNSNLEMFTVRELLSRQAAIAYLVIVAVGLGAGASLSAFGLLSLMAILAIYTIAMAAALVLQIELLTRKGMNLRRCYLVLPLLSGPWLIHGLIHAF